MSAESVPSFGEQLCRPLGVGYDDYPSLLRRYACPANSAARTPDLGVGLASLLQAGVFEEIDSQLANRPSCLIQGITSMRNGASLRAFLANYGVTEPMIQAVDIANVSALLDAMRMPPLDLNFSVADASNLPSFPTGSVQILVQDHLLNCTPHGTHEAIIREAARLLDPRGFMILNFSINPCAPETDLDRAQVEDTEVILSDRAYCLRDLIEDRDKRDKRKRQLIGRIVELDNTGRRLFITPPEGNFEFYFRKEELEERLWRHDLKFVAAVSEDGIDDYGVGCLRYRTVVRHR